VQFAKLLIGESEGGRACLDLLPDELKIQGMHSEVIQCAPLSNNGGCAIVRIHDPDKLADNITIGQVRTLEDGSECSIDRISTKQYVAMIKNKDCKLSRIVSESGCFVTSSVFESKDELCWTIAGMNTESISNLIKTMEANGFKVKRKSTFNSDLKPYMSTMEEEALALAYGHGFYDIPRRIDIRELSSIMGCSKSTLNNTLRNAENKLVTYYMSNKKTSLVGKK
jgi:predicted DNA binding protein